MPCAVDCPADSRFASWAAPHRAESCCGGYLMGVGRSDDTCGERFQHSFGLNAKTSIPSAFVLVFSCLEKRFVCCVCFLGIRFLECWMRKDGYSLGPMICSCWRCWIRKVVKARKTPYGLLVQVPFPSDCRPSMASVITITVDGLVRFHADYAFLFLGTIDAMPSPMLQADFFTHWDVSKRCVWDKMTHLQPKKFPVWPSVRLDSEACNM